MEDSQDSVADVQGAADLLIEASGDDIHGPEALELFSAMVLVTLPLKTVAAAQRVLRVK